ncbi:MAG: hypothetical protein NTX30_04085 [Deltaproteobacteria bacterium]|nr:hypothetical protein [Deltaproteobacteria bacterium]
MNGPGKGLSGSYGNIETEKPEDGLPRRGVFDIEGIERFSSRTVCFFSGILSQKSILPSWTWMLLREK